MSKIKIVQITLNPVREFPDQYLDDKGRVWELTSTGWRQLELPDEDYEPEPQECPLCGTELIPGKDHIHTIN